MIALVFGGCSVTVDSVPSNYRARRGDPPPACTRSAGAPIADAFAAGLAIGLLVMMSREACEDPEDVNGCSIGSGFAKLFFGPPAIVFGFSALVGTAMVHECHSATAAHAALQ